MPETITYLYTSQAEMERLYSKSALRTLLTDLAGPDIAEWWTEIAADATTTIDSYVGQIYNQADLYQSRWVRARATWIGCFRASQRKGQPDLFAQRYEEIIEELKAVLNMQLVIPNTPTSSDLTPAMSNVYVDTRFEIDKLRVIQPISVGGNSGRQSLSWNMYPYDWF